MEKFDKTRPIETEYCIYHRPNNTCKLTRNDPCNRQGCAKFAVKVEFRVLIYACSKCPYELLNYYSGAAGGFSRNQAIGFVKSRIPCQHSACDGTMVLKTAKRITSLGKARKFGRELMKVGYPRQEYLDLIKEFKRVMTNPVKKPEVIDPEEAFERFMKELEAEEQ